MVAPPENKQLIITGQLFRARAGHRWKLTEEDWRNRDRWEDYEKAALEMIAETHSKCAPWLVLPANDKRRARILVLESVCRALAESLEARGESGERS